MFNDVFHDFFETFERYYEHLSPYMHGFDPANYPIDVQWSFYANAHMSRMMQCAYNTMHRIDGWKTLYYYQKDATQEGMLWMDMDVLAIEVAIDDDYPDGHTESSMTLTMYHLYFIAHFGLNEYRRMIVARETSPWMPRFDAQGEN